MSSRTGNWAKTCDSRLGAISRGLHGVAIAFLVLMLLGNAYAVFVRYVVGHAISFSDEVLSYLNIGIIFLGLGEAWRAKGHINVDVIIGRMHGRTKKALLAGGSVAGSVTMIAAAIAVLLYHQSVVGTGLRSYTTLGTPRWIPMIAVSLGIVVLCLETLATTIRDMRDLFSNSGRGRPGPRVSGASEGEA